MKDALFVIRPRIYNMMKSSGSITLEALNQSISLLKFIVERFAADCDDTATFQSINKTLNIFQDALCKRQYKDCNLYVESQIYKKIAAIKMKMTKCTELYPNKLAVVDVLSNVIWIENCEIDLVSFRKRCG